MNWGDSNGKKWEDYDTIKCPNGTVIDMQKLLDDQNRAKAALIHVMPWIGGLISKLKFVYTFRIKTQATDGIHLFVNPQFTANLNFTEKTFVLAHEVMHNLLNHLRRGKGHDPQKSNIAADYVCNITLADIKPFDFNLIKGIGGFIDKKYDNWGYEAIYKEIIHRRSQYLYPLFGQPFQNILVAKRIILNVYLPYHTYNGQVVAMFYIDAELIDGFIEEL